MSSRSSEETAPFGDAFTASVQEIVTRRHASSAGYVQDGPDFFVSVNISAPDATTAEQVGAEILTAGLPAWIAVRTVETRPLLAEPDFTSPPSPS